MDATAPGGQPVPILNGDPADAPWRMPRFGPLPGTRPVAMVDWLRVLDSYPGQMEERERLIARAPAQVHALLPQAEPAAQELFDRVLAALAATPGFARDGDRMRCPDGRAVALDRAQPLMTLGRLVQEDLCLLQRPEGAAEHVLTGAILCFPSGWTLAEKMGRPLGRIHAPVDSYDTDIARRVQRLFDGIAPDRPLLRANGHFHHHWQLFSPVTQAERARNRPARGRAAYARSERQVLLRLPQSRAVVFSIHTLLYDTSALAPSDIALLRG